MTFLEVVIASALLATLGGALTGGTRHEQTGLTRSYDQLRAQVYAESVLERMRVSEDVPTSDSKVLVAVPTGLTTHHTVRAVAPGLYEVDVHVEGGTLHRPFVLTTRVTRESVR